MAGWLITGSLATVAGVGVINLLGEPLTSSAHRPLSSAEIGEALARSTPAAASHPASTPRPTSTPAVSPGSKDRSRLISTEGGTAIARCEEGLVTLRSWSPKEGFQVKSVDRGPDERARVEFESDETKVKIEVRCSPSGSPVHTVDD
ncbi:hypothetical protein GCM10023075_09780 [Streptosporangium album]